MSKIKLCYVIVNCKVTGPMNQTLNIIKNLDKSKYNVSFVTLFSEEENNSMISEYNKVIKEHYCLNMSRISSLIYGKRKLKKVLEMINPDIIHALGMPPYRLSLKYKNAKHLVTMRNYPYDDYPSYYNKLIGPIMAFLDLHLIKKLYKKGEIFVTCSSSLSKIYEEKEKINLPFINNGVDIEKYQRAVNNEKEIIREKLNLPKDKTIYIYTAPFNERKDQEFAIKAFLEANNSNNFLILCGDGATFNDLKNKYKNDNILFTGKVRNIPEYLKASDIYLSTSKSEGLPNSVLEAMSCGLPVLLSNIPQHLEFFKINEKIGYCYELENLPDLVNYLKTIKKEELAILGNHAYEMIINNFSAKAMSMRYKKLYQKMLKR